MPLLFRPAAEHDVPLILSLIRELAEYEKLAHEVVATEAGLRSTLFGARPYAEVLLAYQDGQPIGFCLFFHNYSTFLGKPGLYIEDLYIKPEFRRQGIGKIFFKRMCELARERDCGRMEWWALDWNRPAIDFYLAFGAKPMDEWTVYRLTEDRF